MPYNIPKMWEFELLKNDLLKGIKVTRGAKFEATPVIKKFKEAVQPRGTQLALKYSGFFEDPAHPGEYVFMLGWDHAMIMKKGADGWYADAIYSHSYSEGNPDTWVYDVPKVGKATPLPRPQEISVMAGKHACGSHKLVGCPWKKFKVFQRELAVRELITFSVTSCSFACLWDEDVNYLIVSHMAFSPLIPVAWLAVNEIGLRNKKMNLLASINSTPTEITKITSLPKFPYAGDLLISPTLIARGKLGLQFNSESEYPFMTHPYLGLDLSQKTTIYFRGALGYNNDPTLPPDPISHEPTKEFPPFHSVLANTYQLFTQGTDAKALIAAGDKLVCGAYGYADLHNEVLNQIGMEDLLYTQEKGAPYQSTRLDNLLSQVSGGMFSKPYPVPDKLKGRVRALFLMAELASNPNNVKFAFIKKGVFDAWDKIQLGFSLDMDKVWY